MGDRRKTRSLNQRVRERVGPLPPIDDEVARLIAEIEMDAALAPPTRSPYELPDYPLQHAAKIPDDEV